jgi:hypothetical protein
VLNDYLVKREGDYEFDYTVPWPSSAKAGEPGLIIFYSSGDAMTEGRGEVSFTVQPDHVVYVEMPVHCTQGSIDAGVLDAPSDGG